MEYEMKDLWINLNLGCGDAIICNGLIRTLAKDHIVHIPCYHHNLPSVFHMLKDTAVYVHPFDTHEEAVEFGKGFKNRLLLGFEGENFDRNHFDQSFYKQASLPFSLRWEAFSFPPPTKMIEPGCRRFKFIHDDPWRGFNIKGVEIEDDDVRPDGKIKFKDCTIFDYVKLINQSEECHVIQSSFLHLIDSLPENGQRLVYHEYARKGDKPTLRRPWEILI